MSESVVSDQDASPSSTQPVSNAESNGPSSAFGSPVSKNGLQIEMSPSMLYEGSHHQHSNVSTPGAEHRSMVHSYSLPALSEELYQQLLIERRLASGGERHDDSAALDTSLNTTIESALDTSGQLDQPAGVIDDIPNQKPQKPVFEPQKPLQPHQKQVALHLLQRRERDRERIPRLSPLEEPADEEAAAAAANELTPALTPQQAPDTPAPLTPKEVEERSSLRKASPSPMDEDEDELPELTPMELIGLCLPAAAVWTGWAVGEALLLPFLLSLGVSPTVANFAFLMNPLFGLFLQPLFGGWSDHCRVSWGRRRPFLVLFCAGSVAGLTTVVWCKELAMMFTGGSQAHPESIRWAQIILVFIGFAIMDLSHDLLLMPARALLNDRLPDEQTDQGNSYFACISSLGSCIGLSLTIIPLENYWPWSMLKLPIRATFTTATIIILTCNVITLYMSAGLDHPYEPEEEDDEEEETESDERSHLLARSKTTYGSAPTMPELSPSPSPSLDEERGLTLARLQQHTHQHNNNASDRDLLQSHPRPTPTAHDSKDDEAAKQRWCWCFSENPLSGVSDAFMVLPRPLKVIWFLQLVWWYCSLHVSLWWTAWVAVELFGGPSPEEATAAAPPDSAQHGVLPPPNETSVDDPSMAIRVATIGLLIEAVVSFPASACLPFFNRKFGITHTYHASAIIFGLATLCIGMVSHYWHTFIIMFILGMALPPIFSSSYILVEVYATEAPDVDEDEDEEEDESEMEGSESGTEHSDSRSHAPLHLTNGGPVRKASRSRSHSRSDRSSPSPSPGPESPTPVPSPSPSPSMNSSSRRSRANSRINRRQSTNADSGVNTPLLGNGVESNGSESEYTTATLEENRGTITALFNVTMIVSQTVVGLTSGFIIDQVGNITVIYYISGIVLVVANIFVLFFRLSKPPTPVEEEEEEAATVATEEKLVEAARTEKEQKERREKKKLKQLEVGGVPGTHPPTSPPLASYPSAFEILPSHMPSGGFGNQYVRPVPSHPHPHPRHVDWSQLHRPRRGLVRSRSAPDVRLARRALRKNKAAAKAAAQKTAVRVALFQPHGLGAGTAGTRRDALRGAKLRNNTRAGVPTASGDAAAAAATAARAGTDGAADQSRYQQMLDRHAQLQEQKHLERVREKARLFGIKVATRAAQIKEQRSKSKAKAAAAKKEKESTSANTANRRNNQSRRRGPSSRARGPSSQPDTASSSSSSAATSSSLTDLSAAFPSSSSFSTSAPLASSADNSSVGRVHWSMNENLSGSELSSMAAAMPLPKEGSAQENELIQRLAIAALEREQVEQDEAQRRAQQEQHQHGLAVPIALPSDADSSSDQAQLVLLLTPPHAVSQAQSQRHADTDGSTALGLLLEEKETIVAPAMNEEDEDEEKYATNRERTSASSQPPSTTQSKP